jgi:DNA-directed RNA polymerase specialized sigma24 family protein
MDAMADPEQLPLTRSPYPRSQSDPPSYVPVYVQPEPATSIAALLAHLDGLPALEHQVLKSIYFGRRNLRQTAELLDLPIELVTAATSRALRAVGRLLDAPVHGPGELTG